jgi:hypothetical protein
MKPNIAIATLLSLPAAGAVVLLLWPKETSQAVTPPRTNAEARASKPAPAAPLLGAVALRQVEARLQALEGGRTQAATDPVRRESAGKPPPALSRAEVVERNTRRDEDLTTRLHSEAVDRAWAPEVEGELRRDLGPTGMDEKAVTRLECRSTFCQMVVSVDGDDARSDFEGFVLSPRRKMGALFIHFEEGRSVAYFFRKGFDTRNEVLGTERH